MNHNLCCLLRNEMSAYDFDIEWNVAYLQRLYLILLFI